VKKERSNVDFPLWRKKVDKSIFDHKSTPVPAWVSKMWGLHVYFENVNSKRLEESKVEIKFQNKSSFGNITITKKGRTTPNYRLFFGDDLVNELKQVFLMSHMRAIEQGLNKDKSIDIEIEIPFWEFLDIEFDQDKKLFILTAHYTQGLAFPRLFKNLLDSPAVRKIEDKVFKNSTKPRIYKEDWKHKSDLNVQIIGAKNVIYMLADTKDSLLYIGETQQNLSKRLSIEYLSIPNWNYFRYDVLPDELSDFRVTLERMMIRSFASILNNTKNISTLDVSSYKLVNTKVDQ
jgi:hypothetical protein